MSLKQGQRLGSYEILSPVGAGGMGEVYRARDPKLDREVAIKVLPERVASDADSLARFEREAKTIAALSHPNLVAIFDFGKERSTAYAVMELLEGETLRGALASGALPVRKAVDYGVQIAQGLASAHEKGIVHRDLKPDNIFVTADGRVKILDFGLAAHRAAPDEGGDTKSPTKTSHTDPGTVLGTAGYMAPEQVKGLRVDHRADIFALGVVLYEMLTGRRAFHRDTAAETMAAILKEDVAELSGSGRAVPLSLDRLVRRCLEKRAEERFQSARDLAISLEAYSGADTTTGFEALGSGGNRWTTAVRVSALLALGMLGGILFGQLRRTPTPAGEAQATFVDIALPPNVALDPRLVRLSEDGRRILFKGADRLGSRIWLRDLSSTGAQPLAGTDNALPAGFSPDARRFTFVSHDWVLKSFDLTTSAIKSIAPMRHGGIGMPSATMNSTGDILLAAWHLLHASSAGEAKVIAIPDGALGEVSFDAPQFLPDGRRYLYSVLGLTPEKSAVYAGALGSSKRTVVLPSVSWAAYAPLGYLLFRKDTDLFAQAFDVERLELSGQPTRIAEGVLVAPFRSPTIWVGGDALLFMRGAVQEFQLTWFDRGGRELGHVGDPAEIVTFDLSRDGHRVVASVGFPGGLSLIDTRSNSITRVTSGEDTDPRFSGDAQAVLFASGLPPNRALVALSLNGGSRKEVIRAQPVQPGEVPPRVTLHDWSRDGRFALFTPAMGPEVWSLQLNEKVAPSPVVQHRGTVDQARFSPDGRWVAYNANGTGRMEVFVEPFPSNGESWQISKEGGVQPIWREDSGELFFLSLNGDVMSANVASGHSFSAGSPGLLFRTGIARPNPSIEDYGVTGDGKRFLLRLPTAGSVAPQLTMVMNWPALLKKKRDGGS